MFAFSMMFAAPVFASGDDDWNDGDDHGCFVHDDHGDHWWSNGNHDDDTTPATNPRALRTYAVWRPSSRFNPNLETQKGRV